MHRGAGRGGAARPWQSHRVALCRSARLRGRPIETKVGSFVQCFVIAVPSSRPRPAPIVAGPAGRPAHLIPCLSIPLFSFCFIYFRTPCGALPSRLCRKEIKGNENSRSSFSPSPLPLFSTFPLALARASASLITRSLSLALALILSLVLSLS